MPTIAVLFIVAWHGALFHFLRKGYVAIGGRANPPYSSWVIRRIDQPKLFWFVWLAALIGPQYMFFKGIVVAFSRCSVGGF
jgi:hypothetical protein